MKRTRKGAPKQKWTAEEEAALKAGVVKHGNGKWRTILSDPQFGSALKSRSNVDLKDKWRNISVTAIWGSRTKARLASRRTPSSAPTPLSIVAPTALDVVAPPNGDDNGIGLQIDATTPPAVSSEPPRASTALTSVDKMILESINHLKEPDTPDTTSILLFIEKYFMRGPDTKRIVTSRLKHLINVGTLVKIKHEYSISPNYMVAEAKQTSPQPLLEGNKEISPNPEENGVNNRMKADVDGDPVMIKGMTVQEAVHAASKAVAEAEFARAELREAEKLAVEAEAKAEAASIYFDALKELFERKMRSQTW